jgi:chemotaxis protein CheD
MPEDDAVLTEVYVQPGESHLATNPVIFRTVLGSCVGVTFLAPRLGIGAICHSMLPCYPAKPGAEMNLAAGSRYVDFAIRHLARQFDARGAQRSEVQVKLFGGADVLTVTNETSRPTVGRLNCEAAIRVLHDEGFEVAASSLGGTSGVSIQFHTGTGRVLLRRLG